MIPGRIEGANATLGAPDGWDKGQNGACVTLSIRADPAESGALLMHSVWFPTPEEMAAIAAGAPVTLCVCGTGHPPVMLGVGASPA
jgi:hypothetical protein